MKPAAYMIDIDPKKSHALLTREPRTCECGIIIPLQDGILQPSRCASCEGTFDAALQDKMLETGHAGGWPLYWDAPQYHADYNVYNIADYGYVTTFYGHRKWKVTHVSAGRHNIARRQYHIYFDVYHQTWRGVQFGDNTNLIRNARRVKRTH